VFQHQYNPISFPVGIQQGYGITYQCLGHAYHIVVFYTYSVEELEQFGKHRKSCTAFSFQYTAVQGGCVAVVITLVFDRRTVPVPHSTCSWRVTTYLGKPSAIGQPTRTTQPFILFGVDKLSSELLCWMCAGHAIWWMFTRLSRCGWFNRSASCVAAV